MSNGHLENPYRCVFSLKPLIDHWTNNTNASDPYAARLLEEIRTGLARAPELLEPMEDLSILEAHQDLVRTLMSAVFPTAFWDTELVGALVPFTLQPAFVSPPFRRLLLNGDGSFRGKLHLEWEEYVRARRIRFLLLILKRFYGVDRDFDYPLVRIVQDPDTGLNRHFGFRPDLRFVDVRATGPLPRLPEGDVSSIIQRAREPEMLRELLAPENFEFHGFTVIHAVDITLSQVISELEKDLIDKNSISSQGGFSRLQESLRTLFCRPDLVVGLAAVNNDQVLMLNTGCEMTHSCIFCRFTASPYQ